MMSAGLRVPGQCLHCSSFVLERIFLTRLSTKTLLGLPVRIQYNATTESDQKTKLDCPSTVDASRISRRSSAQEVEDCWPFSRFQWLLRAKEVKNQFFKSLSFYTSIESPWIFPPNREIRIHYCFMALVQSFFDWSTPLGQTEKNIDQKISKSYLRYTF